MNARILVVEDEPPIREGVVDLLAIHGYSVDAAGDGASAMVHLARGGYGLAVLDLLAPPAELLVHVWGYRDGNIETRTVDVTIQKLRSKLRVVPGGEQWIETMRGMGYRLAGG